MSFAEENQATECMEIESIALFATSNAMFADGYVAAFRSSNRIKEFHSYVVGASSSHLYHFFKSGFSNKFPKYIIIECCVNDTHLIGKDTKNQEDIERNLESIICECLLNNIVPIIVIFPIQSYVGYSALGIEVHRSIARKYSLPIFDVYHFLSLFLQKNPKVPPKFLFRDNSHLHPWAARCIGDLLIESLTKVVPDWNETQLSANFTMEYIDVAKTHSGNFLVKNFATSVINASFVEIFEGDQLSIPMPSNSKIVALAFDGGHSAGSMNLERENDNNITSVTNGWFGDKLVMQVSPVFGMEYSSAPVTMTVIPERQIDKSDLWQKARPNGKPAVLYISGIVFEGQKSAREMKIPFKASIDLVSRIGDERMDRVSAAIADRIDADQQAGRHTDI